MVEHVPSSLLALAKLIESSTVKHQANAAGKVLEKLVEQLGAGTVAGSIDVETLLRTLNDLSVNKEFSTWRGNLQKISIKLGDEEEEQ